MFLILSLFGAKPIALYAVVSTNTWSPAGIGLYADPLHWSPGIVPNNDNGSGTNYVARIDGGDATASSVNLGTFASISLDALIVSVGDNLTISNASTLAIRGGGAFVSGTVTLASDGSGAALQFYGTQTLDGTGQVLWAGSNPYDATVNAHSGTLTIGSGMTIRSNVQGDHANYLVNQGTIIADASNQTTTITYFKNQGWLNVTNGAALVAYDRVDNSGTVTIHNSSSLQFYGDYVQTIGATILDGGTLTPVSDSDGSVLIQGGSLGGGGIVDAVVTNSGSIIPGPAACALVFVRDVLLKSSSVLNFQLGGYAPIAQYGCAVLSNGVNLAGSLAVTLVNGFVPATGSSFTVLTSGPPITGGFVNAASGFRIQTADGGGSFVYIQNQNSIVLDYFLLGSNSASPYLQWASAHFGCTNCPQSSELADPDGDGANNRSEFYGGTDPNNSASFVHITSIVRRTNDMVITWHAVGGRTNILQASSGDLEGSYLNGFVDISLPIIVTGVGETTTNWVDAGATTGATARYYRIRLVP